LHASTPTLGDCVLQSTAFQSLSSCDSTVRSIDPLWLEALRQAPRRSPQRYQNRRSVNTRVISSGTGEVDHSAKESKENGWEWKRKRSRTAKQPRSNQTKVPVDSIPKRTPPIPRNIVGTPKQISLIVSTLSKFNFFTEPIAVLLPSNS
jgi:hypothetical protein